MWLPTIPFNLIAAINRAAAATGSVGYAMKTEFANYNGHSVRVYFNDYRQYWLAEYQWGQRVVLHRGDFDGALLEAKREYEKGALGSSVIASVPLDSVDLAVSNGLSAYSEEIAQNHYDSFATWAHPLVWEALRSHTDHLLIKASSLEEYENLRYPNLKKGYASYAKN